MLPRARACLRTAAVLAVAGAGLPALAAEGMPQLQPWHFAGQIFWLAVTFVVLYVIMSSVVIPRLGDIVEGREKKIAGDLDRAAALRAEAEQIGGSYEKALADARAEAQGVLRAAQETMARMISEAQASMAADLAKRAEAAEAQIAEAKRAALANVREIATDVASAATARLTGAPPPRERIEAAVGGAMAEEPGMLEGGAA